MQPARVDPLTKHEQHIAMNLRQAKERVASIEAIQGDDEAAHSQEDELYLDFVKMVAKGTHKHAEIAREILRTKEMNCARWCA